jgi:hypothetical protein
MSKLIIPIDATIPDNNLELLRLYGVMLYSFRQPSFRRRNVYHSGIYSESTMNFVLSRIT